MTDGHLVTRTLTESVWYPSHDARKASAEYTRVHHHLVYVLDEACFICGVRQSQLPKGEHNETHHWALEWALANSVNPALILADFPEMGAADDPHLRAFLDSEANLFVLCSKCHRGGRHGIHMITMPVWLAQRYQRNHDITNGT